MKTKLFLIRTYTLLHLTSSISLAQTPDYLWAKSAGGTSFDTGNGVSTDTNGNVFVTGSFKSSSITFGTNTLTNAGGRDIFLVKYDANGTVLWAKSAGGTSDDYGYGVSTDTNGNVLVTGYFESSSITFGATTLTNAGNSDIFIVKYAPDGTVLWAKSEGGTSWDYGNSISTDANGNVLVTGYFQSSSITFGSTTLINTGSIYTDDIFIVKYDTSGNVRWAKSAGGTSYDSGRSVSTDTNGNVFVTGYFQSSSIIFGTTTLTNAGNSDIFIVKYDASGNVLWAESAGGTSDDYGYGVSTDANGNVFVTGYFDSDTITFSSTTLTNAGASDIFIMKYDASGNILWAESAGGNSSDVGYGGVSTDANGNALVTGYFYSDTITFGSTTLTNAGGPDIFVVKLDGITGITESLTKAKRIEIYPNPNNGKFTLSFNHSTIQPFNHLTIYNMLGEMVYQSSDIGHQSSVNIDLSRQPAGIYFVQLITNEETTTKKIVKQ